MTGIGESVKKIDHDSKISGEAQYIADLREEGILYGKIVRSSYAKARIVQIKLPLLPEGYGYADWQDIQSGKNVVRIIEDDMPVFANGCVEYIGEPILIMVGPLIEQVENLCKQVEITYELDDPIVDMADAQEIFYKDEYCYGDVDTAFSEADFVVEEAFETGYQEHAYLEPQGIVVYPQEKNIIIKGSMQCPYYIQNAVSLVLGMPPENVRVIQSITGGGFGGKEDYPSIVACEAAVAAHKFGKPIRLIYDRREDMEFTSKRHPSRSIYRAAVKNARITAMDIDVTLNAGAYRTLSLVVLQRTMICAGGVYRIDNIRVRGKAVKTNTVPCGAFRGFGDPQVFFSIEMFINHLSLKLGQESWEYKLKHMVKKGDYNSTRGVYHFPVPLPAMMERLEHACNYKDKKREYAQQSGRYRKGIGIGLHFHGTGFASTKDMADGVKVKLRKSMEGDVYVLTANTDMGQGLATTFAKIVGEVLDIPYNRIKVPEPDTDIVPDSGPTVASRSILTVGELVRKAAVRLKDEWEDGKEQIVEENFRSPDYIIPFEPERFYGDPYPAYAWGAAAVELEVDTYTGIACVQTVYGIYDVGTVIDRNIVLGQMEGGILQGIGYASMEQMNTDSNGRIRNNSYSDYIIPSAADVPNIQVELYETVHLGGPFGAKGAGELPNGGVSPAYAEALEQALRGCSINHIPFSAEETLKIWEGMKQA